MERSDVVRSRHDAAGRHRRRDIFRRRCEAADGLEGGPRLAYEFWHDHLRPLGFGLRAEVLEYPGGMPGDIGFFLTWK